MEGASPALAHGPGRGIPRSQPLCGKDSMSAKTKQIHRLGMFLVVLASAMTLSACMGGAAGAPGKDTAGKQNGQEEETPAAPVVVGTLTRGPMDATVSSASTIEAERKVTIHAESTGRVLRLEVEEGQLVESGDLIATLRRDAQSNSLERASASYEKAEADLKRIEGLHAKGVASDEELANAKATLRNAALDRKDRSRDLSNTRVHAPFSGTITERSVAQGAWVNSGGQLCTLVDFTSLVARVYVPERELDRIAVGQVASIVGKAAKGRVGTGTVTRIAPVVDAATGTVKVTVALSPDSVGPGGFLPGMYAEVTLVTEHRDDVLVVPKSAVVYEDDQVFAFVVEPDAEKPDVLVARRHKLTLGLSNEESFAVEAGLTPSDKVILAGQAGLKDGAKVRLVDAKGQALEGSDKASDAAAVVKADRTETKRADATAGQAGQADAPAPDKSTADKTEADTAQAVVAQKAEAGP